MRSRLQDVAIAFGIALLLMAGVSKGGDWVPAFVVIAVMMPGVYAAYPIARLFPADGDDGPALYAGLSVVSALVIWWAIAFIAIRLWRRRAGARIAPY